MDGFSSYLLWISVHMTIVLIAYMVVVKRTAGFNQSRMFIVYGIIASVVMGVVGAPVAQIQEGRALIADSIMLPEVVVSLSSSAHMGLETSRMQMVEWLTHQHLLRYTFYAVTAFFLFRFLGGIILLVTMVLPGRRASVEGLSVVVLKKGEAPFSFLGMVFIPSDLLSHPRLNHIILHEKAHIEKHHDVELLFMELMTVLFWFHPAIWYLRRELKLQHEFEADRYVLGRLDDKLSYQNLLLEVGLGSSLHRVTNSFNNPPLKKRMMMMKQSKPHGGKRAIFYMMLALPLLMLAFYVQSCSEDLDSGAAVHYESTDAALADQAKASEPDYSEDQIFPSGGDPPVFTGGESARQLFLRDNLVYPLQALEDGLQGTVFVSFVVRSDGRITDGRILRGLSEEIDAEVLRVIELMPNWKPGVQRGEPVSTQLTMPVRFTLE